MIKEQPNVIISPFGTNSDEDEVLLYTLVNTKGMELSVSDYGGIITSVKIPKSDGTKVDVALGYSDVESYIEKSPFFGATVGRYGNRIGGAKFEIDGVTYDLNHSTEAGEYPVQLHGGVEGFDKKMWKATPLIVNGEASLQLEYTSLDGEEGFPGRLQTKVVFTLTDQNEIKMEYSAETDKTTHVNLTDHSYFNLKGEGQGDVLDHEITIKSSTITAVDKTMIPTGELMDVAGTPFDLNQPVRIADRIDLDHEQLKLGGGFDHTFVLDQTSEGLSLVAKITEPQSGLYMEVVTEEPGVQFYTGNFIDEGLIGKSGKPYGKRTGFCLETQHYPDSPNKPEFPSTLLKPGEVYSTTTLYRFGWGN